IQQIPCVEAVDCFNGIMDRYGYSTLTTVHRNKFKDLNIKFLEDKSIDSIREFKDIISVRKIKDLDKTVDTYVKKTLERHISKRYTKLCKVYPHLNKRYDILSNVILTYRNDTRKVINDSIRSNLGYDENYSPGEYMMILKN